MTESVSKRQSVDGLRPSRALDPCCLVILGASGDLTRRKLVPAVFNLLLDGLLPAEFAVVGTARRDLTAAAFAEDLRQGVADHSRQALDPEAWENVAARTSYVALGTDPSGYRRLAEHLEDVDRRLGTGGNRLFYLSIPPSAIPAVIHGLQEAGLNRPGQGGSWTRIIVEKPIGHDLESARELNRVINGAFDERDVFRIDHYLGKETVQNLLVFRFANAIFEPLWNQKYVDHVQITVAESLGVEGRGDYYEEAGATRDMVQNHLFQLLCLTAMEPPVSLAPDAIRDEKVKVLQSLRPVDPSRVSETTVRGQYAAGVIDGKEIVGYKDEPGVSPESRTETYVALGVHLDNWRWAGVPFYLRAGKRLHGRLTEIALRFKDVPHRLFRNDTLTPNTLALRIQPDEGMMLTFDVKVPGTQPRIKPVDMDFLYETAFGKQPPEAYERLLLDAMHGDSTLFIRRDEVEASWSYIDRLQESWAEDDDPLPEYTAGSWGPAEAHVMLAQDGHKWRKW
jgi:glucose-6-phosphate 1-dehydrogenase